VLTASSELRILYSANRNGEIEPCHCVEHQLGGVVRLASFVDEERRTAKGMPVFWGDAGDSFFSVPVVPDADKDREWVKAEAIARALAKLGLDAFTPGERDFAEGVDALRKLRQLSGAVFVTTNLEDESGHALFERSHLFPMGSLKVGVLGLADPEAFTAVAGVKATSPKEALEREVKGLREAGAQVVILLSHLGLPKDREIAATGKVDVILGSHSNDPLANPLWIGKAIVVQPLDQGQQVGAIDYVSPGPEIRRHRLADLDEKFEAKNDLVKLVDEYKRAVHDLEIHPGKPRAAASSPKPFVAHPFYCRTCHQAQYEFWSKTKHAAAYLTLYAKNEHFDPNCVGCHTLGYRSPNGFSRVASALDAKGFEGNAAEQLMKKVFAGRSMQEPLDSRVHPDQFEILRKKYVDEVHELEAEKRIDHLYLGVQCEHCHGNRHGHPGPDGPKPKKVAEQTCRACHRPPNAPEFDPKWKVRIACPLMKKG
jgi:hypothetical protein